MVSNSRFLLDTNIFIWWMGNSTKLPKNIYSLINNPQNQIFLSVASIWEIVIKRSKHNLRVPKDIEKGINSSGFELLEIGISHIMETEKLPPHHKDPFDRVLIAQTRVENLTLITTDSKIKKYEVKILS